MTMTAGPKLQAQALERFPLRPAKRDLMVTTSSLSPSWVIRKGSDVLGDAGAGGRWDEGVHPGARRGSTRGRLNSGHSVHSVHSGASAHPAHQANFADAFWDEDEFTDTTTSSLSGSSVTSMSPMRTSFPASPARLSLSPRQKRSAGSPGFKVRSPERPRSSKRSSLGGGRPALCGRRLRPMKLERVAKMTLALDCNVLFDFESDPSSPNFSSFSSFPRSPSSPSSPEASAPRTPLRRPRQVIVPEKDSWRQRLRTHLNEDAWLLPPPYFDSVEKAASASSSRLHRDVCARLARGAALGPLIRTLQTTLP